MLALMEARVVEARVLTRHCRENMTDLLIMLSKTRVYGLCNLRTLSGHSEKLITVLASANAPDLI